jgi:protein-arginine kinase activator protein McsA
MNSATLIVPWKCHICQGDFDTSDGGICSRCNKATCLDHLHQIGSKKKLEATWVCQGCLTNEEKTAKKVKWKIRLYSLSLKKVAAKFLRRDNPEKTER